MAAEKLEVDLDAPGVISSHCEFCGKKYYIDAENMQVMHDLPMCPEFEMMDPMTFVVENRKIKQAKVTSKGNN